MIEVVGKNKAEAEKNARLQAGGKAADYLPLRFRSTGLGKTVLQGVPADIKVVDDMLVVQIQAVTPVQWQIRAAISFKGVLRFLKLMLTPSIILFLLRGITTLKNPRLSDEF